jgi:hypothetical protein
VTWPSPPAETQAGSEIGYLCEHGAHAGVVGADSLLDRLAEVLPQMPRVSDLHCPRGTRAGALGIRSGPVPADDLYFRVVLEPDSQRFGVASRQDVDGAVALQIDQDGGVRVALPQCEIVDAENPDLPNGLLGEGSDQA